MGWRSALAGRLERKAATGAGVRARERTGLGFASVQVRSGKRDDLAARLASQGVSLLQGPRASAGAGLTMLCLGPRSWLAVRPGAPSDWAEGLRADLDGVAAVADQSSAYTVLRLDGPKVRSLLAKGIAIDLHPRIFAIGAVAALQAAHAPMIVWRTGEDAYDLLVGRSYAAGVWAWLEHSAAEFGLAVDTA
jgi:sarcosine oxidase subunit gamma